MPLDSGFYCTTGCWVAGAGALRVIEIPWLSCYGAGCPILIITGLATFGSLANGFISLFKATVAVEAVC